MTAFLSTTALAMLLAAIAFTLAHPAACYRLGCWLTRWAVFVRRWEELRRIHWRSLGEAWREAR